jgi:hypothetical protein
MSVIVQLLHTPSGQGFLQIGQTLSIVFVFHVLVEIFAAERLSLTLSAMPTMTHLRCSTEL